MKTDKLFYRIFLTQPQLIRELVPGIPEGCEFDYRAPVVKEKEFRLDGVLVLTVSDARVPLVFLEAQMQDDAGFYGRFFAEVFLYLQQYPVARPWRGVLLLRRRGQVLGSELLYGELLDLQVQRLYLEELLPREDLSPNLGLLRLVVVPESEAAAAARGILAASASLEEFRQRLEVVEAILVNKFPRCSVEEIWQMLDLREASLRETRL